MFLPPPNSTAGPARSADTGVAVRVPGMISASAVISAPEAIAIAARNPLPLCEVYSAVSGSRVSTSSAAISVTVSTRIWVSARSGAPRRMNSTEIA